MAGKNNELITVYKDGAALEVTRKAYNVHYQHHGYSLEEGNKKAVAYTLDDLKGMNEKELKKVTNDQYKSIFDDYGIEYEEDATKNQLIALIPDEEEPQNEDLG